MCWEQLKKANIWFISKVFPKYLVEIVIKITIYVKQVFTILNIIADMIWKKQGRTKAFKNLLEFYNYLALTPASEKEKERWRNPGSNANSSHCGWWESTQVGAAHFMLAGALWCEQARSVHYSSPKQPLCLSVWHLLFCSLGKEKKGEMLVFQMGHDIALPGMVSGLSARLQTKGTPVRFPVRVHAWAAGQVPSWGRARGSCTLMFLSLFLPPLPSL